MSLGLFPVLPLLSGCAAGVDDASAQGQTQPRDKAGGGSQSSTAPAPTKPSPAPALASGVFRPPGLLITKDDFTRIRALIDAGQEPWTTWWKKLCADFLVNLDSKPNPQEGVYRLDRCKYAL